MTAHEPVTLLTDYLLAALAGGFAWRLHRSMPAANRAARWWSRALGLTAASAFVGGSYHGFASFCPRVAAGAWWLATLLIIDLLSAALAAGLLHELVPVERQRPWRMVIGGKLLVLAGVAFMHPVYAVAIIDYGLALLAWAIAALWWRRAWCGWMLAGVALSATAAFVQQISWELSPWFNHNDLYHVVQAIALCGFFCGGKKLSGPTPRKPGRG